MKLKLSSETDSCIRWQDIKLLKKFKLERHPVWMLGKIEMRDFSRVMINARIYLAERVTGTLYNLDGSLVSGHDKMRIVFGEQPTGAHPRDVEEFVPREFNEFDQDIA